MRITEKPSLGRKTTAIFLLVSFLLSNSVSTPGYSQSLTGVEALDPHSLKATQKLQPLSPARLNLPSEIGTIEDAFQGSSGENVIVIQDAHAVGSAQKSILKIIEWLSREFGISLIGLEGASGKLDPTLFRNFPDRERLEKVFGNYLESGELSGAAAASVLSGSEAEFFGVEEQPLYEEGVDLFLKALRQQPKWSGNLKALEEKLEISRKKNFSKELYRIERKIKTFFQSNSGELSELLEFLDKQAPENLKLLNTKTYPHLTALYKEINSGALPDEAAIQKSLSGFVTAVEKKLKTTQERQKFHEMLQNFKTERISWAAFANDLAGFVKERGIPVSVPRDLHAATAHWSLLQKAKGGEFFDELHDYSETLKNHFTKTESEKDLLRLGHKLWLLDRLVNLKLSRKEWAELENSAFEAGTENPETAALWTLFDSYASFLVSDPSPFYLFYQNAHAREGALFENLTKRMNEKGASHSVLVTGGFHSEGISAILKEKNISYALVSPAITEVPDESRYVDYMRGEVSWKSYFQPRGGKINLYDAFAQAASDLLLLPAIQSGERAPALLKLWRDQILRDLSLKGSIVQASDYTRFIDQAAMKQVNAETIEKLKEEWAGKVNSFVTGLKNLKKENRLNAENIIRLTQRVNAGIPGAGIFTWTAANSLVRNRRVPAAWVVAAKDIPKLVQPETDSLQAQDAAAVSTGIGQVRVTAGTIGEILPASRASVSMAGAGEMLFSLARDSGLTSKEIAGRVFESLIAGALRSELRYDKSADYASLKGLDHVKNSTVISLQMEMGYSAGFLKAIEARFGKTVADQVAQATLTGGLGALMHDLFPSWKANGLDIIGIHPIWEEIKKKPYPEGPLNLGRYQREVMEAEMAARGEEPIEFTVDLPWDENYRRFAEGNEKSKAAYGKTIRIRALKEYTSQYGAPNYHLDAYYLIDESKPDTEENRRRVFDTVYSDDHPSWRDYHMALYARASEALIKILKQQGVIKQNTVEIHNEVFVSIPKAESDPNRTLVHINHSAYLPTIYSPGVDSFTLLGFPEWMRQYVVKDGKSISIVDFAALNYDLLTGVAIDEHYWVLRRNIFRNAGNRLDHFNDGEIRSTNGVLTEHWQSPALQDLIEHTRIKLGLPEKTDSRVFYETLEANSSLRDEFVTKQEFIKSSEVVNFLIWMADIQKQPLWLEQTLKESGKSRKDLEDYAGLVDSAAASGDAAAWEGLQKNNAGLQNILLSHPMVSNVRRQVPYKGPEKWIEVLQGLKNSPEKLRAFKETKIRVVIGGRTFSEGADNDFRMMAQIVKELGLEGHFAFIENYNVYDAAYMFRAMAGVVMLSDEFLEASATSMMKGVVNGAALIGVWGGAMPELFKILDENGEVIDIFKKKTPHNLVYKNLKTGKWKLVNGFMVRYSNEKSLQAGGGRRPEAEALAQSLFWLNAQYADHAKRRELLWQSVSGTPKVDMREGQARAHMQLIERLLRAKEHAQQEVINTMTYQPEDFETLLNLKAQPFVWRRNENQIFKSGDNSPPGIFGLVNMFREISTYGEGAERGQAAADAVRHHAMRGDIFNFILYQIRNLPDSLKPFSDEIKKLAAEAQPLPAEIRKIQEDPEMEGEYQEKMARLMGLNVQAMELIERLGLWMAGQAFESYLKEQDPQEISYFQQKVFSDHFVRKYLARYLDGRPGTTALETNDALLRAYGLKVEGKPFIFGVNVGSPIIYGIDGAQNKARGEILFSSPLQRFAGSFIPDYKQLRNANQRAVFQVVNGKNPGEEYGFYDLTQPRSNISLGLPEPEGVQLLGLERREDPAMDFLITTRTEAFDTEALTRFLANLQAKAKDENGKIRQEILDRLLDPISKLNAETARARFGRYLPTMMALVAGLSPTLLDRMRLWNGMVYASLKKNHVENRELFERGEIAFHATNRQQTVVFSRSIDGGENGKNLIFTLQFSEGPVNRNDGKVWSRVLEVYPLKLQPEHEYEVRNLLNGFAYQAVRTGTDLLDGWLIGIPVEDFYERGEKIRHGWGFDIYQIRSVTPRFDLPRPETQSIHAAVSNLMVALNMPDLGATYDNASATVKTSGALDKTPSLIPVLKNAGFRTVYAYGLYEPGAISHGLHSVEDAGLHWIGDTTDGTLPRVLVSVRDYETKKQGNLRDNQGNVFSPENLTTIDPRHVEGVADDEKSAARLTSLTQQLKAEGMGAIFDFIFWRAPESVDASNYKQYFHRELNEDEREDWEAAHNDAARLVVMKNLTRAGGHFAARISEGGKERLILVQHMYNEPGRDQAVRNPFHPEVIAQSKKEIETAIDRGARGIRIDLAHKLLNSELKPMMEKWAGEGWKIDPAGAYRADYEPLKDLIAHGKKYAAAKGQEFFVIAEAYMSYHHDQLRKVGVDAVYYENLHRDYVQIASGASSLNARNLADGILTAYENKDLFSWPSNYDVRPLRRALGSREAFLLSMVILALSGAPVMIDVRELIDQHGQLIPIPGRDHPFPTDEEIRKRRDFDHFRWQLEGSPFMRMIPQFLNLIDGRKLTNLKILDNQNRDQFISLDLEFEQKKGRKTVKDHLLIVLNIKPFNDQTIWSEWAGSNTENLTDMITGETFSVQDSKVQNLVFPTNIQYRILSRTQDRPDVSPAPRSELRTDKSGDFEQLKNTFLAESGRRNMPELDYLTAGQISTLWKRFNLLGLEDAHGRRRWVKDVAWLAGSQLVKAYPGIIQFPSLVRELEAQEWINAEQKANLERALDEQGQEVKSQLAEGRAVLAYGVEVRFDPVERKFTFRQEPSLRQYKEIALMPRAPPRVVISVLVHNGWEETKNFLASLSAMKTPNAELVLMDNGSAENHFDELIPYFHNQTARITLAKSSVNLGFDEGHNVIMDYALDESPADHIFVLNNDVEVDPDFVNGLLTSLEEKRLSGEKVGSIGPIVYRMEEGVRTNKIQAYGADFPKKAVFKSSIRFKNQDGSRIAPETVNVDYVVGPAVLFSADALRLIGGYDPAFFAYGEELDISLRLEEAGFSRLVTNRSVIGHEGGAASRGALKPFIHQQNMRNLFLLVRKHESLRDIFSLTRLILTGINQFLQSFLEAARTGNVQFITSRLRGLLLGLMGNFSKVQAGPVEFFEPTPSGIAFLRASEPGAPLRAGRDFFDRDTPFGSSVPRSELRTAEEGEKILKNVALEGISPEMPFVVSGEVIGWEPKKNRFNVSLVRPHASKKNKKAAVKNETAALKEIWKTVEDELEKNSDNKTALKTAKRFLRQVDKRIEKQNQKAEAAIDWLLEQSEQGRRLPEGAKKILREHLVPALSDREEIIFIKKSTRKLSAAQAKQLIIDRYQEQMMIKIYGVILNLPYGFNTNDDRVANDERLLAGSRRDAMEKQAKLIIQEIAKGKSAKLAIRPAIEAMSEEAQGRYESLEEARRHLAIEPKNETYQGMIKVNQHHYDTALEQIGYLESLASSFDTYDYIYELNDMAAEQEKRRAEELQTHIESLSIALKYFPEDSYPGMRDYAGRLNETIEKEIEKGRPIGYAAAKFFSQNAAETQGAFFEFLMRYFDIVENGDPDRKSDRPIVVVADRIDNETDYNKLLGNSRSRGKVVAIVTPKREGELRIPHWYIFAKKSGIVVIVSLDFRQKNLSFSDVSRFQEGIVDGKKGIFIINPTPEVLEQYQALGETYKLKDDFEREGALLPAVFDGRPVNIYADETSLEALKDTEGKGSLLARSGAKGNGLYRLEELLLADPHRPGIELDDDRLSLAILDTLTQAPFNQGARFVIRLFDVAPDKFPKFVRDAIQGSNPVWNQKEIETKLTGARFYLTKDPNHAEFREFGKRQLKSIFKAFIVSKIRHPEVTPGIEILISDVRNAAEVFGIEEFINEAKENFLEEVANQPALAKSLGISDAKQINDLIDALSVGYMFEDTMAVEKEREAMFQAIKEVQKLKPAKRFIGIGSNDLNKTINKERMDSKAPLNFLNTYLVRDIAMVARSAREYDLPVNLEGEWGGSGTMLLTLLALWKMEGLEITPVAAILRIPELLELVRNTKPEDFSKPFEYLGRPYPAFSDLLGKVLDGRELSSVREFHDTATALQGLIQARILESPEYQKFVESQKQAAAEVTATAGDTAQAPAAAERVRHIENLEDGRVSEKREYVLGYPGWHMTPGGTVKAWLKENAQREAFLILNGERTAVANLGLGVSDSERAHIIIELIGESLEEVEKLFSKLETLEEFPDFVFDQNDYEFRLRTFNPDLTHFGKAPVLRSELRTAFDEEREAIVIKLQQMAEQFSNVQKKTNPLAIAIQGVSAENLHERVEAIMATLIRTSLGEIQKATELKKQINAKVPTKQNKQALEKSNQALQQNIGVFAGYVRYANKVMQLYYHSVETPEAKRKLMATLTQSIAFFSNDADSLENSRMQMVQLFQDLGMKPQEKMLLDLLIADDKMHPESRLWALGMHSSMISGDYYLTPEEIRDVMKLYEEIHRSYVRLREEAGRDPDDEMGLAVLADMIPQLVMMGTEESLERAIEIGAQIKTRDFFENQLESILAIAKRKLALKIAGKDPKRSEELFQEAFQHALEYGTAVIDKSRPDIRKQWADYVRASDQFYRGNFSQAVKLYLEVSKSKEFDLGVLMRTIFDYIVIDSVMTQGEETKSLIDLAFKELARADSKTRDTMVWHILVGFKEGQFETILEFFKNPENWPRGADELAALTWFLLKHRAYGAKLEDFMSALQSKIKGVLDQGAKPSEVMGDIRKVLDAVREHDPVVARRFTMNLIPGLKDHDPQLEAWLREYLSLDVKRTLSDESVENYIVVLLQETNPAKQSSFHKDYVARELRSILHAKLIETGFKPLAVLDFLEKIEKKMQVMTFGGATSLAPYVHTTFFELLTEEADLFQAADESLGQNYRKVMIRDLDALLTRYGPITKQFSVDPNVLSLYFSQMELANLLKGKNDPMFVKSLAKFFDAYFDLLKNSRARVVHPGALRYYASYAGAMLEQKSPEEIETILTVWAKDIEFWMKRSDAGENRISKRDMIEYLFQGINYMKAELWQRIAESKGPLREAILKPIRAAQEVYDFEKDPESAIHFSSISYTLGEEAIFFSMAKNAMAYLNVETMRGENEGFRALMAMLHLRAIALKQGDAALADRAGEKFEEIKRKFENLAVESTFGFEFAITDADYLLTKGLYDQAIDRLQTILTQVSEVESRRLFVQLFLSAAYRLAGRQEESLAAAKQTLPEAPAKEKVKKPLLSEHRSDLIFYKINTVSEHLQAAAQVYWQLLFEDSGLTPQQIKETLNLLAFFDKESMNKKISEYLDQAVSQETPVVTQRELSLLNWLAGEPSNPDNLYYWAQQFIQRGNPDQAANKQIIKIRDAAKAQFSPEDYFEAGQREFDAGNYGPVMVLIEEAGKRFQKTLDPQSEAALKLADLKTRAAAAKNHMDALEEGYRDGVIGSAEYHLTSLNQAGFSNSKIARIARNLAAIRGVIAFIKEGRPQEALDLLEQIPAQDKDKEMKKRSRALEDFIKSFSAVQAKLSEKKHREAEELLDKAVEKFNEQAKLGTMPNLGRVKGLRDDISEARRRVEELKAVIRVNGQYRLMLESAVELASYPEETEGAFGLLLEQSFKAFQAAGKIIQSGPGLMSVTHGDGSRQMLVVDLKNIPETEKRQRETLYLKAFHTGRLVFELLRFGYKSKPDVIAKAQAVMGHAAANLRLPKMVDDAAIVNAMAEAENRRDERETRARQRIEKVKKLKLTTNFELQFSSLQIEKTKFKVKNITPQLDTEALRGIILPGDTFTIRHEDSKEDLPVFFKAESISDDGEITFEMPKLYDGREEVVKELARIARDKKGVMTRMRDTTWERQRKATGEIVGKLLETTRTDIAIDKSFIPDPTTGRELIDKALGIRVPIPVPEYIRQIQDQDDRNRAWLERVEADEKQKKTAAGIEDWMLDPPQKEAILDALNTQEPVVFIQGPGGTGKTTVISLATGMFYDSRKNVMIVAQQNNAIDNAGVRLGKELVFARVGNSDQAIMEAEMRKIWDRKKEILKVMGQQLTAQKSQSVTGKAQPEHKGAVILGTTNGTLTDRELLKYPALVESVRILIVDESSRATFPELLTLIHSLPRLEKVIFVGDHKQLPAYGISEEDAKIALDELGGRETTEFSFKIGRHAFTRKVKGHIFDDVKIDNFRTSILEETLDLFLSGDEKEEKAFVTTRPRFNFLNIQRRSGYRIVDINNHFYNDKLVAGRTDPGVVIEDDTEGLSRETMDRRGDFDGSNAGEADRVIGWVSKLMNGEVDRWIGPGQKIREKLGAKDIAVVTPYNNQIDLIQTTLYDIARLHELIRSVETQTLPASELGSVQNEILQLMQTPSVRRRVDLNELGRAAADIRKNFDGAKAERLRKFLGLGENFVTPEALDKGEFTVITIDSSIGHEYKAVIHSWVRSNPKGNMGFLARLVDGFKRRNVATGRPQDYEIWIWDRRTFENTQRFHELNEWVNKTVSKFQKFEAEDRHFASQQNPGSRSELRNQIREDLFFNSAVTPFTIEVLEALVPQPLLKDVIGKRYKLPEGFKTASNLSAPEAGMNIYKKEGRVRFLLTDPGIKNFEFLKIPLIAEGERLSVGIGHINKFEEARTRYRDYADPVFAWWFFENLKPFALRAGFREIEILQGPMADSDLEKMEFKQTDDEPGAEIWVHRLDQAQPESRSELREMARPVLRSLATNTEVARSAEIISGISTALDHFTSELLGEAPAFAETYANTRLFGNPSQAVSFYREHPEYDQKLAAFLRANLDETESFVREYFANNAQADKLHFAFAMPFSPKKEIQDWWLRFLAKIKEVSGKPEFEGKTVSAAVRILATASEIENNPVFFEALKATNMADVIADGNAIEMNQFLNQNRNALVYAAPEKLKRSISDKRRIVSLGENIFWEEAFAVSTLINFKTAPVEDITPELLKQIPDDLPMGMAAFNNGGLVIAEAARELALEAQVSRLIATMA